MYKIFFLFTFLLFGAFTLDGQTPSNYSLGLSFDDAAYQQVPYQGPITGRKFNNIRPFNSLRKYCPFPTNQGLQSSCVGHATRSAFTIEKAIKNKMADRGQITKLMHSAGYIYNQIKVPCSDCTCGSRITDALLLMHQQGSCLSTSFEAGNADCSIMPEDTQHEEAAYFKVKDFAAIFQYDEDPQMKIDQTLKMLNINKPVLIGMNVTTSFWTIQPGQKHWEVPANDRTLGGHAMVVVGYDMVEKKVELLNSYGTDWGDAGFITIDIEDYGRLVKYGFVMTLDDDMVITPPNVADNNDDPNNPDEPVQPGTDVPADVTKQISLKGDFVFRYPKGYKQNDAGERVIDFEEANAYFDKEAGKYRLERKDWKVNDIFQLVGKNMKEGQYIYVYSIDPTGRLEKHWPSDQGVDAFQNVPLSANIPSEDVEIIMPGEENALQLAAVGEDHLIVIYSEYAIDDIADRMERIKARGGDYVAGVREVFGDVVVPTDAVKYTLNQMQFSVNAAEEKGTVVPLVLGVMAN